MKHQGRYSWNEKEPVVAGLCHGRHTLPDEVTEYIFPENVDPTNLADLHDVAKKFVTEKIEYYYDSRAVAPNAAMHYMRGRRDLHLYVTGLSVALLSVVEVCADCGINLICWHYNKYTGEYYEQVVLKY